MEQFKFYFTLGWEHILSTGALDHILFIACLAIIFLPKLWKQLLALLTAFTIGHSITLSLNVFSIITVKEYWVEIFIPLTIIITAILNIRNSKKEGQHQTLIYILALLFGLVHGLAYATSLRFMLADTETIGVPLLAFNIGIEVGQIIVASVILLINYLMMKAGGKWYKYWLYAVCLFAIIAAGYMVVGRF